MIECSEAAESVRWWTGWVAEAVPVAVREEASDVTEVWLLLRGGAPRECARPP